MFGKLHWQSLQAKKNQGSSDYIQLESYTQMCTEHEADPEIITASHPLKALLPNVVSWPRDASDAFFAEVSAKYFSTTASVQWFHYCILIHRAKTPREAIEMLQAEGAFATHVRRSTLTGIVEEAQNSQWCAVGVLDTVFRYATYAFVLDGSDVTCGALPED